MLALLVLAAGMLAFTVMTGAFTQSAHATTAHQAAKAAKHHFVALHKTKSHARAAETTTGPDPAGGPNDQAGGPDTGAPDTEASSPESETGAPSDGPGGPNSDCVDNVGCQ
jgi:hypothetical protein